MARTTTNESSTADADGPNWNPNFIVNGMPAYTVPPSKSYHLDPDVPMNEYCTNRFCEYCNDDGPMDFRSLDFDPDDYREDPPQDIFCGMLDNDQPPLTDDLSYSVEISHLEWRYVRPLPSDLEPIEVGDDEPQDWDEYVLNQKSEAGRQVKNAWDELPEQLSKDRDAVMKDAAQEIIDHHFQPRVKTKPKHRTNRERGRRPQQAKPRMTTPEHRRRDQSVAWRDSRFDNVSGRSTYTRRSRRSKRQRELLQLDWDSQEQRLDLREEAQMDESEEVSSNLYGYEDEMYRAYIDDLLYLYGSTETPGYTRPAYSRLHASMPMAA